MRRVVGPFMVGVLLLGACTSAPSTTSTTSTTVAPATPAEQNAARQATVGFRALMTQAGQRLVDALNQTPPDATSARLALDEVRVLLPHDPQGRSDLDHDLANLSDPAVLTKLRSSLAGISLLLSHVVRAPSAIVGLARLEIEWVASRTPEVLESTSTFTVEDLRVTTEAARRQVATTAPLGSLVAPARLAEVEADLARLANLLDSGASPRATVQQADASIRSLSLYQQSLVGFGTTSVDP